MKGIPQSPDAVYAFWVGFPYATQCHILKLCAKTPSVDTIAVFQDYKWTKPQQGCRGLLSVAAAFCI
jgi:hypothetical protein